MLLHKSRISLQKPFSPRELRATVSDIRTRLPTLDVPVANYYLLLHTVCHGAVREDEQERSDNRQDFELCVTEER